MELGFIDALLNPVKRISSFQKEMQESIAKFFFSLYFFFLISKNVRINAINIITGINIPIMIKISFINIILQL